MASCPVCGSQDVRPSRRESTFDFFHRWRGLRRFRCRDCRKTFLQPRSAAEREEAEADRKIRKKRSSHSGASRRTRQRRIAELCLFFALLVLFYFALRFIIRVT